MKNKVLVVEDYDDSREFIRFLLEDYGFDVMEATNGREAVEALKEQAPDLILMDIAMPVMDGLTATRLLKADGDLHGIPVIALTAHAMASDEAMARDAGCDGYISKPVMPKDVRAEVERWIGPP